MKKKKATAAQLAALKKGRATRAANLKKSKSKAKYKKSKK